MKYAAFTGAIKYKGTRLNGRPNVQAGCRRVVAWRGKIALEDGACLYFSACLLAISTLW
jgi:hypothetical protein